MVRWSMKLIRQLGSVHFAVIICLALMGLLITSTTLESRYGTALVQKSVYQTRWFDFLLALLWINIFCATVLRLPFQKKHAAFVVTHIGILGLLLGSLITRTYGQEGQLTLREQQSANVLMLGGAQIRVSSPGMEDQWVPVREGTHAVLAPRHRIDPNFCPLENKKSKNAQKNPTVDFKVTNILDHAARDYEVKPGDSQADVNLAVKVAVSSAQAKMQESIWLVEHDPFNPEGFYKSLGPLDLMLLPQAPPEEVAEETQLRFKFDEKSDWFEFPLTEENIVAAPLGNSGWVIRNLVYLSHARVAKEGVVNLVDSGEPNPAVKFDLVSPEGKSQPVLKFALFPHFEMLHQDSQVEQLAVQIEFTAQNANVDDVSLNSYLAFWRDETGALHYQSRIKGADSKRGKVNINESISAGWMDAVFKIEAIYDRAVVETKIIPSPDPGKGATAVEIAALDQGTLKRAWIIEGKDTDLAIGTGDWRLALVPIMSKLPFTLTLKDFQKVDYPGTQQAASYESKVVLEDPAEKLVMEKTISMNQPLSYRGYKIFQSSFFQDPHEGEGSIFTVAKNPGIGLIYNSSTLIFLGAFFQFYGKKLSASAKKTPSGKDEESL